MSGQRVVVTGGSGFVGSYAVEHLLRDPSREVCLLVRPESDLWRLGEMSCPRLTTIRGDLTAPASYRDALAAWQPDTVVHLAWDGVGPAERDDPRQLGNIQAAIDLIQAAGDAGVKHWIGMGSQAEYGPHQSVIRETEATRPTTLYGASKLAVSHLGRLGAAQRQMRFVWLRVFSTYGAKDHPRWLIPSITLQLLRRESPKLTEGRQNWDYIHVDDIASAVRATVDNLDAQGIYNVGSGRVVTVRRVVERVRDLIDPSLPLVFGELLYRPDQVMHLEADITRLQRATGWTPVIDLDQGLAQTVGWYRQHVG